MKKKRLMSILLALLFAVQSVPVVAKTTNSESENVSEFALKNMYEQEEITDPVTEQTLIDNTSDVVLTASTVSGSFSYSIGSDGTATITDYTGDDSVLVIPETIDGYTVTSIGSNAFQDCTGITSITFPESLTTIGSYAFENCTGLIGFEIPDSVTSLAHHAFNGCSGITSITIPKTLSSYGDDYYGSAFAGSSITTVIIE
ncbi:MAG: leucine-rich repeat domain-containing protein, partial [Clostridia bacterium]|nr:leucine-rich repeat domain-containing protein [Clostridia bacterium]